LCLGNAFQEIYKLLFAFISVEGRQDREVRSQDTQGKCEVAGNWQSDDVSDSLAIGTSFRTMWVTAAGPELAYKRYEPRETRAAWTRMTYQESASLAASIDEQ
jgi:hypothetical protein